MGADVVCWDCGGFERCTCELPTAMPDEEKMVGQVTVDAIEVMRGTAMDTEVEELQAEISKWQEGHYYTAELNALKREVKHLKSQMTALCARLEKYENVPNALAETYHEASE